MDYKRSLENLETALSELRYENSKIPIIVEGDKDIHALHKLDIDGTIIRVNDGTSLIVFCDKIAQEYKDIIILTDWDRKGGFLKRRIQENLKGRVKCNNRYRKIFAKNTMTKTVEGLPSYIETITSKG